MYLDLLTHNVRIFDGPFHREKEKLKNVPDLSDGLNDSNEENLFFFHFQNFLTLADILS